MESYDLFMIMIYDVIQTAAVIMQNTPYSDHKIHAIRMLENAIIFIEAYSNRGGQGFDFVMTSHNLFGLHSNAFWGSLYKQRVHYENIIII